VLNRYQDEAVLSVEAASYLSRGLLLVELIDCRTRSQTQSRIKQISLAHFRPFTLLILEPGQPSFFREDLFYPLSLRFFEPQFPPIVFQDEAGWSEGRSGLHRLMMTM
jgi:hypothetical protein